jgi:ferrous iron transport protein B
MQLSGAKDNAILLVGNPNVGKSVIFAYLTGRYAVVSNYPGTTVEVSSGPARFDRTIEIIDTPGVNSLYPKSEDEKVTRDILLRNRNATVVQVADAKNLLRALQLTVELAELGCRTVLVLNMMDEARQRGIFIDESELSRILGIEVVVTVAVEKRGLPRLVHVLTGGESAVPAIEAAYPGLLQRAIGDVEDVIGASGSKRLFGVLTALSGDAGFLGSYEGVPREKQEELREMIEAAQRGLPNPFSFYIAAGRNDLVERVVGRISKKASGFPARKAGVLASYAPAMAIAAAAALLYALFGASDLSRAGLHPTLLILLGAVAGVTFAGVERVNRYTLHPVFGLLILAVVLYLVYMLVGVFAAGVVVDFLENRLFSELIIPAIRGIAGGGRLGDFLLGDYGLVSMGLNYSISIVLPIVTVFFLVFGILEDTGYFPRLTVLTNRAFRLVGVNGKATLPIVLGFGCVTMAVLASRILETRKERIIVITLLALAVPCSAQLGIILALLAAISARAVALIVCIIIAEFVIVGRLLSRMLAGQAADFILELPPLRAPRASNISLKTWARVKWFIREAVPFFLLAAVVLYILDISGGLNVVFRITEPVLVRFLGLPVESATAFIIGFFRRDYGAAGLYKLWESGQLGGNQVVVSIVVMSLFLPCLASLIVMIKEIGMRLALSILLLVMFLSLLSGGLLNLVLGMTGVQL